MADSNYLTFSNRLYRYIKATAIENIFQAGVELITNSDDAYNNSTLNLQYVIDVKVDYKTRTLTVFDQAIGMDSDNMNACFGQVGSYTASSNSRGYFSRGAKDISAIGFVEYVGIKDNKISKKTLSSDDIFTSVFEDVEVTTEDRQTYDITKNGLWVRLHVNDKITFPSYSEVSTISDYYSLRDIFSDQNKQVIFQIISEEGYIIFNKRLQYTEPEVSKILIDETYKVDGYEGVEATFKLELLTESSDVNANSNFMRNGILIADKNGIHEVTTLYNDIRNHPYVGYIRGRLTCSHINQLMHDYENATNDTKNPFPIINHSRTGGLSRDHPFTKALFRIPHKQLKYVLQDLYHNSLIDQDISQNLLTMFKDIQVFGASFFHEVIDAISGYKTTNISNITGYLNKKSNSVVTNSESESEYDFSKPDHFYKSDNSNIEAQNPEFTITFSDKEFLEYQYYIYRIDSTIHLEINLNDFMVRKYIRKNEDNSELIIFNREGFNLMLVDLLSEAMSRELIKEQSDSNIKTFKGFDDMFSQFEKTKKVLLPKLYELIFAKDVINVLV